MFNMWNYFEEHSRCGIGKNESWGNVGPVRLLMELWKCFDEEGVDVLGGEKITLVIKIKQCNRAVYLSSKGSNTSRLWQLQWRQICVSRPKYVSK